MAKISTLLAFSVKTFGHFVSKLARKVSIVVFVDVVVADAVVVAADADAGAKLD